MWFVFGGLVLALAVLLAYAWAKRQRVPSDHHHGVFHSHHSGKS